MYLKYKLSHLFLFLLTFFQSNKGVTGPTGPAGPTGKDGKDGKDGKQGPAGVQVR